jgi:hypothetical protein
MASKVKTVFASDLGWKAGVWPEKLVYDGMIYRKSTPEFDEENELMCVRYISVTDWTVILIVYND